LETKTHLKEGQEACITPFVLLGSTYFTCAIKEITLKSSLTAFLSLHWVVTSPKVSMGDKQTFLAMLAVICFDPILGCLPNQITAGTSSD